MHFGMTGGLHVPQRAPLRLRSTRGWAPPGWPPRFAKLMLTFDDGGRLALADARRLGRIRLREDPRREPPLADLGFDALHELPPAAQFHALLRERTAPMKAVLLDQTFAAGVGNWIADEVLYQARCRPTGPRARSPRAESARLRGRLRAVLATAVRVGADGDRFPRGWLFHRRWDRDPLARDRARRAHPLGDDRRADGGLGPGRAALTGRRAPYRGSVIRTSVVVRAPSEAPPPGLLMMTENDLVGWTPRSVRIGIDDGPARLSGPERDRAAAGGVVEAGADAGDGGAVGGGEVHGDLTGRPARARYQDGRVARLGDRALGDGEQRRRELHHATHVVVEDQQGGGVAAGHEARADRPAQREVQRLGALHERVLEDRHRERPRPHRQGRAARREGQGPRRLGRPRRARRSRCRPRR